MKKIRPEDPDKLKKNRQSWKTFLENHREYIMAMDFFIVPTVSFKILYVFFIIVNDRRKIIHFNVTENPRALWVLIQLRNAFPFDTNPKYLIFDRGPLFTAQIKQFIKDMGTKPKQICYMSPWQNGTCERWILSIRSEVLNHVVIFHEDQLQDYMRRYIEYYNKERCHLSVGRDSPMVVKFKKNHSNLQRLLPIQDSNGLVKGKSPLYFFTDQSYPLI